jgi:deazaflavin-dependent oxidoreductase (nitroreductase family)
VADTEQSTPWIWQVNKKLRGLQIKVFQSNNPAGNLVLLLTTTGRKTGLERVTPLQYEEHDSVIYVASARGEKADWFRNIQANPRVRVQIRGRHFSGSAEPITDPERIADFLELRLQKHPLMVRLIMTLAGLPLNYSRDDLVQYATGRAMVIIHRNDPDDPMSDQTTNKSE